MNPWVYENVIPLIGIPFAKRKEIPVIFYHNVVKEEGYGAASINIKKFLLQLEYLRDNGYETLTFSDIPYSFLKESADRKVLITFDDGWISNYEIVFPEMLKRNLKFNIFITVGYMENSSEKYMNWEHVREMYRSGMVEFGAHTYSHVDCCGMDDDTFQREFLYANREIEKQTGICVKDFCFPYGKYDSGIVRKIYESKLYHRLYTSCYSSLVCMNDFDVVGRANISNDDSIKVFKNKLNGNYRIMEKYLTLKRGALPTLLQEE